MRNGTEHQCQFAGLHLVMKLADGLHQVPATFEMGGAILGGGKGGGGGGGGNG